MTGVLISSLVNTCDDESRVTDVLMGSLINTCDEENRATVVHIMPFVCVVTDIKRNFLICIVRFAL